jgi:hypothetical protein
MLRADEKFAMLNLDLPGRVLPLPKGTSNLDLADLLQLVGKMRQTNLVQGEVDIPAEGTAPPADSVYVVVMRRRRR